MKELYLYSPIYDFIAQDLIQAMEEAGDNDVVIRVNSPGGSVFSGWGIVAKMRERQGKTCMMVDGAAMSMAAYSLLFADEVVALDVSTIMLHRADMSVTTAEQQAFLDSVNKQLRAKLEAKIDLTKLPAKKQITMDQLFASEERVNLFLTAKEAKAIGLVDKIVNVDVEKAKSINAYFSLAAEGSIKPPKEENQNQDNMKLAELKAKHPELFDEIFAMGVAHERDRVEACLVFIEVDPKGVSEAIAGGKPLSQKQMAEFSMKIAAKTTLKETGKENAGATNTSTPGVEKTPGAEGQGQQSEDQKKKLAEFEAEAKKELKLK